MLRRAVLIIAVSALLAVCAGCDYKGLNQFHLPGTQGSEDGSYRVRIELANVGNLVANNPVRVNDVNVGNIDDISLDGWNAAVTVSLNPGVHLPENAIARVGQGSLLGAKYVEIDNPTGEAPRGELHDGSVIGLAQTGRYPETEDVLAAVATLLNGGNLQQIATITGELNRALGGRGPQFRDLLLQLNTFITGLEAQKADIVKGIDGLDRLSANFAKQDPAIDQALHDLPPALAVLNQQREQLVDTLDRVGDFGTTADDVLGKTREDLARNLENLQPALKGLADAGPSLTNSLYLLGTLAFPLRTFDQYVRGDFINFSITVDLTLGKLDGGFLTGTPFAGALGDVETILQKGGTVTGSANPLLAPLFPGQTAPPGYGQVGQPGATPPGQVGQGYTSGPPPAGAPPAAPPAKQNPNSPLPSPGGVLGGLLGGGG